MLFFRLFILTVLVVTAGSCCFGETILSIEPPRYDFGQVRQGDDINGLFSITSTGSQATDLKVIAGCSCMTVAPESASLTQNESMELFWNLDTANYSGPVSFNIIVIDESNKVFLSIEGIVEEMPSGFFRSYWIWIAVISIILSLLISRIAIVMKRRAQSREKESL